MMFSSPLTFSRSASAHPRRSLLGAAFISLLLSAGCSNGAQDATNTDVIGKAQAKTSTDTKPTANAAQSESQIVNALQANLQASGINEKIISAVATDMPGIYWVSAEGLPSFFTDKSGQHIIQGQIIQVGGETPVDISAALIARSAKEKLATVDKKDMIIYPANGETKAVVYAFTDADCGYCRKFHEEIKQTNDLGIEVRYLAWPRSEQSVPKMEAIWCSKDQRSAMDQAKAGANISAASCANPVQSQLQLGMSLGVRGTPAVFSEDGQQIGGYLPSRQIAKVLGIS